MMIIGIPSTYSLFRSPTTVLSENSIHHFWDGDRYGDGTDMLTHTQHTQNARKQLQESFTKGAKMMHREITDKCISVHKLENQFNNTWNMKMIYRSK
jgi:hypothetical protein